MLGAMRERGPRSIAGTGARNEAPTGCDVSKGRSRMNGGRRKMRTGTETWTCVRAADARQAGEGGRKPRTTRRTRSRRGEEQQEEEGDEEE